VTTFDPDTILSSASGAPALKFPDVGTTHKGVITGKEARQQTDFKTGEPKVWTDGKPMMEVIVTLDLGGDEEGRLFCRGQLLKAVREAIRNANATTLEIGGTLAVQFTHEEPSTTRGYNPAKCYRAQYQPPSVAKADDLLAAAPSASDLL
jgi:hypothetical protein